MRMDVVIVGDPSGDLPESPSGVRQGVYANIVALEGFYEGFRHAVRLRTADRGEARLQVQRCREVARLLGGVGAAIVREMLDRVRRPDSGEAPLHRLQHDIAHIRPADPGTADGCPGDDLAVEGIDDEGQANDLAVPASELQPVGA